MKELERLKVILDYVAHSETLLKLCMFVLQISDETEDLIFPYSAIL